MSRFGFHLAVLGLFFIFVSAQADEITEEPPVLLTNTTESGEQKEYYPLSWTKIDFRPIVDNSRLFKKYKECYINPKPTGCPGDIVRARKLVPEVIDTNCGKCRPEHIAVVKEATEYVCKKRPADYEEIKKKVDPTGELWVKFIEIVGEVDC
ncbi:hypothetical protein QAD02_001678 [Eretmocerus hayati]|uniref:Uncharacterized protein n=1 Tax=Eretmocerus hayati TaxID=131215 RepID=A0ACC2NGP8_9HYME|nr:hypothetical protein QAD02_001678 [Eretmocerus hayati]